MISGNNFFIIATVAVVFSQSAIAAEAGLPSRAPPWGLETLMQQLAQIKTAKARFVEHKYLQMLDSPLTFSGILLYTAPDELEKKTLLPKPQDLRLQAHKLTMDSEDSDQRRTLDLEQYPMIWALVEGIRSTLAGDLETLDRFYSVSMTGSEDAWHLRLSPRVPKMRDLVNEIRISGSKKWINTIETIQSNGDRSVMTVTGNEQ